MIVVVWRELEGKKFWEDSFGYFVLQIVLCGGSEITHQC